MFYESQYSKGTHSLTVGKGDDFSFPPHLHQAFELICITAGKMRVYVDGTCYELCAGEAVLVFPDQVHSLECVGHCSHYLWIFSPDQIKAYTAYCKDRVPVSNRFVISDALMQQLTVLNSGDSIFRCKGVLYCVAAEFDAAAEYCERSRSKDSLLWQIFDYVRQNFTGECTLRTLSSSLSYSYVYLSRYFKERTGSSFTAYVNRYRINESCYLLTNTADSVTDIALGCGFDSVRSFHRQFREQIGMTPGEYHRRFFTRSQGDI